MTKIISEALKHKGFAFVEILQYCPTYYHDVASPLWFKEHLYDLNTVKHDPSDISKARQLAEDITDKIGIGIFYKDSSIKPFYDRLENRKNKKTELVDEVKGFDIGGLVKEFV